MHLITTTFKAALVGLALTAMASPALAGPEETEFLHRMAGTWTGEGRVSGEESGTVSCRLTLKPSGERLNFNGRCNYSGSSAPQSFSGRISYNDRTGQYETSSRGNTAVGSRKGSTLTFVTQQNDMRGKGTSTMSLSPSSIKVQVEIVSRRGGASKGSIPFTKA